ncbi:MAG: glycosyltransferase family 2 protein [Elusimicrobiota bacterium]
MSDRVPTIAVLTPVFNEEESLPRYEEAVRRVFFSRTDLRFEVWLIDDGSQDGSWACIVELCLKDARFHGLRLSRNFGSHVALSAGFDRVDADAVATLACDLQDPPEVVLRFAEEWRKGAQIVWGHRRTREDAAWRTFASGRFAALLRRYAMPKGSKFTTGSFLLVDRVVADCFRQFTEHNRITFALVAWTGFRQAVVDYDRVERAAGVSGWTFRRMLKTMYDAFIGFSHLPIRMMTLVGIANFLLAVALGAYLLLNWALNDSPLRGYTSIMLVVVFFFGVQFLLMGIMGEYLYRIYAESTERPLYFIMEQAGPDGAKALTRPYGA